MPINEAQQKTIDKVVKDWESFEIDEEIRGPYFVTVICYPAHGGGSCHYIIGGEGEYRTEG